MLSRPYDRISLPICYFFNLIHIKQELLFIGSLNLYGFIFNPLNDFSINTCSIIQVNCILISLLSECDTAELFYREEIQQPGQIVYIGDIQLFENYMGVRLNYCCSVLLQLNDSICYNNDSISFYFLL